MNVQVIIMSMLNPKVPVKKLDKIVLDHDIVFKVASLLHWVPNWFWKCGEMSIDKILSPADGRKIEIFSPATNYKYYLTSQCLVR